VLGQRRARSGLDPTQEVAPKLRRWLVFLWGDGQEVNDGAEVVHLGLQLGVRCEVAVELLALIFGEGAEGVSFLEVVERSCQGSRRRLCPEPRRSSGHRHPAGIEILPDLL